MTRARARSLRRSLPQPQPQPQPPTGGASKSKSIAHESEEMIIRTRRRKAEAVLVLHDPQDWRDWANLLAEMVGEIAGRLLAVDVAEYIRFRAVCGPWRERTADPRVRRLDARFRPRNWAVLTITPPPPRRLPPRRRLLNLATAASIGVVLPALSTHCHLCAADGLLVLFNKATNLISLLDPLTNTITGFPAIFLIAATATAAAAVPSSLSAMCRDRRFNLRIFNGAGFDDTTSPPTLVLCLRDTVRSIIVAKPGDSHWTLVNPGEASYREYDSQGQLLFHSVLSWRGRCYVASPEGSVYVLELRPPLPRLVEIIDQRRMCPPDTHHLNRVLSFLVGSGTGMLMARNWIDIKHFGGAEAYDPAELFTTVGGFTGRLEVLELDDIAKPKSERSLLPVRSLGRHAAFVGNTHCLLMSTETFPSLATDAIYLGYRLQRYRTSKFSVYTIDDRRIEPPHQFCLDEEWRLHPSARPCNLDQYLVCYVDRLHSWSGDCINSKLPHP
uniref:KIB1-4 beta-propeller domain-containing protein n=1 Tax=Oryza nivara TaxID=4536 RepID=A0A0E0I9Q3_ORYNI